MMVEVIVTVNGSADTVFSIVTVDGGGQLFVTSSGPAVRWGREKLQPDEPAVPYAAVGPKVAEEL